MALAQLTLSAVGLTASGLSASRHDLLQPSRLAAAGPVCSADRPASSSRRIFTATTFAAVAAVRPLPGVADIQAGDAGDGTWAEHTGPFDDAFFKGFTSTDSGFKYKLLNEGAGEKPQEFQKVYVHYTGYLMDGTKFDSSYPTSAPYKFRLNKGKVITGWESVVKSLRPGQKIPPQFAYGDKGKGDIPKGATLVFYMELVRTGNIKGDKPRLYGTIGGQIPPEDQRVQDED